MKNVRENNETNRILANVLSNPINYTKTAAVVMNMVLTYSTLAMPYETRPLTASLRS